MAPMTVGEVARRSGVTRKALRLYEARGILPPPRRTAAGYRIYAPDVLDVLDFVQQGRRLGLTLAEIKHIISLRRSGAAPCGHVRRLLTQKEADLKALLAEVRRILTSWPLTNRRTGTRAGCPVASNPASCRTPRMINRHGPNAKPWCVGLLRLDHQRPKETIRKSANVGTPETANETSAPRITLEPQAAGD